MPADLAPACGRPTIRPRSRTRQAAAADAGIKALIPLEGTEDGKGASNRFSPARPFLDYVLSAAAEAGFHRVCLVIGPEQEAIRHYYTERVAAERLRFAFACQREPRGTADAVAAAESFAADDPFVAINSDTYYPVEALCGHCGNRRAAPWRCSNATPCWPAAT